MYNYVQECVSVEHVIVRLLAVVVLGKIKEKKEKTCIYC